MDMHIKGKQSNLETADSFRDLPHQHHGSNIRRDLGSMDLHFLHRYIYRSIYYVQVKRCVILSQEMHIAIGQDMC